MKESYGKGVANHTDPESCKAVRKDSLKALTRACIGPVLNREMNLPSRVPTSLGGYGRQDRMLRQRERHLDPARSQTRSMYGNSLRENREIPCLPARTLAGRVRKSKDVIWQ